MTAQNVALLPVQKRVIEWGEDGLPVMTAQPVLTRQHVQSLYMVVAAQPYVVDDPLDPDFGKYDGMTVAEVLVRKEIESAARTGDIVQIETVMDRLIGRPMSRGENVTVHASYEDYLKGVAEREKAKATDVPDSVLFGELV